VLKPTNVTTSVSAEKLSDLQLAPLPSVHGVRALRAEAGHAEVLRAPADLLVWSKGNAYLAVRDLGVFQKMLRRRHDLRHPRLVVGPSSVVPEAVMTSWPICSPRYG